MEYYIYNVPVFVLSPVAPEISVPDFCERVQSIFAPHLLRNIDVVYMGEFKELKGQNAAYLNGGIYMTSHEPTTEDFVEDFVHEVAHSLESDYAWQIYDDALIQEFKTKRMRLGKLLTDRGYHINPLLYSYTEYNEKFDNFLANEIGYPALLNITMGLFVSPYGATSIQEYFANGFEKYLLESPSRVKSVSPVLYRKIEEIVTDDESAN